MHAKTIIGGVVAAALSGLTATLPVGPVAHAATTTAKVAALAIGRGSFPSGAQIIQNHVDTTSAQISSDAMYTGAKPAKQGDLYQGLHFAGSVFETATLTHPGNTTRVVEVMVTLFPTTRAATQAYVAETAYLTQQSSCPEKPVLSTSIATVTCGFVVNGAGIGGATLFDLATVGKVEYIIVSTCNIHSNSEDLHTVTSDTTTVARHLIAHLQQLNY